MSLVLLFHYLLLNMFRMLLHPSSGACDLLWIYFMCCIALVRCVLVLRCGSASVVWYPYAGWSTSASACVRIPKVLCSKRRSLGCLWQNYKTLRLCTSKRNALIFLELQDSLFLQIVTFHKIFQRQNLESNFGLGFFGIYFWKFRVY